MRTTHNDVGVGEKFEHRINHFQRVRELQEETGGFTALSRGLSSRTTSALGGRAGDESHIGRYLKTLAISRLYLDNIKNVQSSWVTQDQSPAARPALGGNGRRSVMLEENVCAPAGVTNCTTEEECAASSAMPASARPSATRWITSTRELAASLPKRHQPSKRRPRRCTWQNEHS